MPLVLEKAKVVMYADDSTLSAPANTLNQLKMILDEESKEVISWIKNNQMVLNTAKTVPMVVGSNSSETKS